MDYLGPGTQLPGPKEDRGIEPRKYTEIDAPQAPYMICLCISIFLPVILARGCMGVDDSNWTP